MKDLIIDAFGRIHGALKMTLKGLDAEQLSFRPDSQANSIGWLAWHLTRVQDDHVSDLAGREQAWVSERWHEKFGKPADPNDTGFGYNAEQVAGLAPFNAQLLLDYYEAVAQRSREYLDAVTPEELDRVLDEPQYNPKPTVGVRLVSVIADSLEHAGQAAYVRGLAEGKHWFPV